MGNVVLDNDFLKFLATMGVGGVLAGFMFAFYRKDVRQYTELWKAQTAMLVDIVKDNTASNTKLLLGIEALHRRLDADNDRTRGFGAEARTRP